MCNFLLHYLRYQYSNQIMIYIDIAIALKVLFIKNHIKICIHVAKGAQQVLPNPVYGDK